jgi:hypothetical protein
MQVPCSLVSCKWRCSNKDCFYFQLSQSQLEDTSECVRIHGFGSSVSTLRSTSTVLRVHALQSLPRVSVHNIIEKAPDEAWLHPPPPPPPGGGREGGGEIFFFGGGGWRQRRREDLGFTTSTGPKGISAKIACCVRLGVLDMFHLLQCGTWVV